MKGKRNVAEKKEGERIKGDPRLASEKRKNTKIEDHGPGNSSRKVCEKGIFIEPSKSRWVDLERCALDQRKGSQRHRLGRIGREKKKKLLTEKRIGNVPGKKQRRFSSHKR